MAGDFEEKYLLLRDENLALKKKKNEQEATIKRMYTKLAIIEEAMKKKRLAPAEDQDNQDDPDAAASGAVPARRDLETEKFVQALKTENAQLRKKNQALMDKNRQLEEKMRQHQLKYHSNPRAPSASATNASLALKKHSPAVASKVHAVAAKRSAGPRGEAESLETQVDHARRVHRDHLAGDLEMALKNRLVIAEKHLVKLQQENEQLRALSSKRSSSLRRRVSGGNNNALSDGEGGSGDEHAIGDMDMEHLRRELRDRKAQVSILNARYENLEANAAAEREIQEQTIEQLEHMNRQVHKLRSQLQDSALDKEELEARLSKSVDLERELAMLRDQNRKLEERMTSLCESPFINDAFQRKERIDKLFDLEKQTQEQKTTIARMTEDNQKLHVTIKELESNVKLMKQAKEMVEQDMDKLRQQLVDERNARSLAAVTAFPTTMVQASTKAPSPRRPSPIFTHASIQPDRRDAASSPLKGEQPAQFPSSMPVVTRRYPDPTLSGALATFGDVDGPDANSVKHLRNRIHVLQLAHLKAIQELERCEKMLHAQTNINKELAQEIEELTTKNVSSAGALQKRLKELEISVEEKQQRIQLLEAQNRQLKYAREKLVKAQEANKKMTDIATSSDEEDDSNEVASVTESLVLAARDLSPGEQLLEIWIVGATFDRSVITGNASTFVLCDFYDFESQSTPLLVGHRPQYNFSSMFKVTVDAFFLRYLASETLVFELHQAIQGDFRLVGRASVALHSLLRSKGVIKDPELPIKLAYGAEHDMVIGTLNVALRFAAPISEIWKLHLRSYPQDIQLLNKNRLGAVSADPMEDYAFEDGFEDNQIKAVNELQITVFACRGLRSFGKKKVTKGDASAGMTTKPSSYVHYQILGFPDMFTNIVPSSSSPEYDLHVSKQYFTVEVDACLLQFFSKFELWFTVFDDQVDIDDEGATDGAIGRCGLALEEITKGENLRGWFQLRDRNGQPAGEISILIEWKDPFQVAQLYSSTRRVGSSRKTGDLHSLDYDQQHAIMRLFAPDMDGRVNYRQFLTYALPPESLELVTSKIKERLEYAIDTEQIQSAGDIFAPKTDDPSARMRNELLKEISSTELQKRLERFGVFLKDEEFDLLEQVFTDRQHLKGATESQKLQVHYLLQHINPRFSCAERLLLHKIRHTLRVFARADKSINKSVSQSPSQPFERYDPAQSGYVSRAEFKRCLGALGFELLDIDKAYKEFVERETRLATTTQEKPEIENAATKPAQGSKDGSIDLDEETLSKEAPVKNPTESISGAQAPSATRNRTVSTINTKTASATAISNASVDARSEFERRKEVFLERMKAIASTSAKSSVYEELEKKKEDRRVQAERSNAAQSAPVSQRVEQHLAELHVPKALHHDAARILQRQFRQYRLRHSAAVSASVPSAHVPAGSIVEIDAQLSRMLKTWRAEELEALETNIIDSIEQELPKARKDRFISRKQLGFVLSKIPRIALEPELLRNLTRHFAVASKSDQGDVAYRPLVHFVCTVTTDPRKDERPPIPVMRVLSNTYIDANHVHQIVSHVGDMNGTGRITVKRFHEALSRAGLRLSTKELRVLTVLLSDIKGIDVLYLPLLKLLRDSPVSLQMNQVVSRCSRYGVARLREALLARISTEDGQITREQLHSVLMQENAEVSRFEPNDSYVLMQLAHTGPSQIGADTQSALISIDSLVLTLERLVEGAASRLSDSLLNAYKLPQLQRLAMSSRSLLCSSYADMLAEFERFDWKETGLVSLAEFAAVVPRIGFTLFTAQQVSQLANNFGAKLKGAFGINYRQFLDWTTPSASPDVESIESKLRRWVSDQASETNQVASILTRWRDSFARADKLSTGFISRGEFASVCSETLRLPLGSDELRTLLFNYDRNMDDRVDYGAFVQLNWKESRQVTNQQRKQVQFERSAASLSDILGRLLKGLLANKVTAEDAMRVAANTIPDGDDSGVDMTQFIVCMKQLGVTIAAEDAAAIFTVHAGSGQNGDVGKLHLVRFLTSTLGLPSRQALSDKKASSLSKDEDDRLRSAVTSAFKYSRKELDRALAQLEEFCVVYNHGDIPTRKLWKHFERNGLTSLLSKKGAGLLIQKFSVRPDEDDDRHSGEQDDEAIRVSLRKVSEYLQEASRRVPAQITESEDPSQSQPNNPSPLNTAIMAVRQLVVMCENSGRDIRADFEDADPRYTGVVEALEFKSILLDAGLTRIVRQSRDSIPLDAVIGVLVREFRTTSTPGSVNYTALLGRATSIHPPHALDPWVGTFSETLRSRIRLKAGFKGAIHTDFQVEQLCSSLDAAFAHFDQQKDGFLTANEVSHGLRALKYELSSEQIQHFMDRTGVFRHSTGNGGLSRMEFDAFVLDPLAPLLLKRLADALYQPTIDDPRMPRVAQLSRLFIERDQRDGLGVLPVSTAWASIQEVIHPQQLPKRDQRRLQTMFDVNRDGMFAFKLFMKVMSQWQAGIARIVPVDQNQTSNQIRRASSAPRQSSTFQCSRDDVVRSLYNQLSSIDFDSQIEIFTEYLRRQDDGRGNILLNDFESVMARIGLRLSSDGSACLVSAFGSKDGSGLNYRTLLKAIQRAHKEEDR